MWHRQKTFKDLYLLPLDQEIHTLAGHAARAMERYVESEPAL